MRFLDVKTDYAFKKVFGSEESVPVLISFLNAILGYTDDCKIKDLSIADPYQIPMIKGMKDTFVDVKAELNNGKKVIIEMQVLNVKGFEKRILHNTAKQYSRQLKRGENYHLLNPVIALTFTDFIMFDDTEKYISHFRLLEKERHIEYPDDIELIFVELPKFKKKADTVENIKEKWIYFLKNAGDLDYIPEKLSDPCIKQAFQTINEATFSEKELELQEKRYDFIRMQKGALKLATEQGLEQGLERGIERGLEQGSEKRAIVIARNMKKTGMPVDEISQLTDLSIKQINEII